MGPERLSYRHSRGASAMAKSDPDLLQGTLDLMILKSLSGGPRHGYGVARWLEAVTADALRIEEGSLYPALHRLEARRWVRSEWGLSSNKRRARYYRLTARGEEQLTAEIDDWRRFV